MKELTFGIDMRWITNPTHVRVVTLGLLLFADSAYAQCVIQAFTEHLNDPEVTLIFYGTRKAHCCCYTPHTVACWQGSP